MSKARDDDDAKWLTPTDNSRLPESLCRNVFLRRTLTFDLWRMRHLLADSIIVCFFARHSGAQLPPRSNSVSGAGKLKPASISSHATITHFHPRRRKTTPPFVLCSSFDTFSRFLPFSKARRRTILSLRRLYCGNSLETPTVFATSH